LTIAGVGLLRAVIVDGRLAGSNAACEGATIGAIFWLLRRLYFAFRKIQGLGLGDVKFLAAAGIWSGIEGLPLLMLAAALTALACAGLMQMAGRQLPVKLPYRSGRSWRSVCCSRWACNWPCHVAEPQQAHRS
jgi:leader peptidase (prepilin peptidase)/N-methyltransferase